MKPITASDITGSISEADLHAHLELFSEHIDTALVNARANAKTDIKYILPAQYNIGNINAEDAQIVILSELIALYKKRGFTDITVSPEKHLFMIRWEYRLPGADTEPRRALIREHTEQTGQTGQTGQTEPVIRRHSIADNNSPKIAMGMARRGSTAGINPSDAALSPIMRTPPRNSPLGQIIHSPGRRAVD